MHYKPLLQAITVCREPRAMDSGVSLRGEKGVAGRRTVEGLSGQVDWIDDKFLPWKLIEQGRHPTWLCS